MNPFVERHQSEIGCVLSCFDRVVITGTFPDICHPRAMAAYLGARDIRLFDYARWAEPLRDEVRANAERLAAEAGVEIDYATIRDAQSLQAPTADTADFRAIVTAIVGAGDATTRLTEDTEVTVSCAEGDTGYVYAGTLAFLQGPCRRLGIETTFVNWRGFFAAPGISDEQLGKFQDALTKMYATPEWEEVRARNGWVNIHNNGDEFRAYYIMK